MKILIVCYYELKDALKCAAESLEKLGYSIISYPLFKMAYDINDKREDYKEHFDAFIEQKNPDILLFWFINIPSKILQAIKEKHANRYFIWFNWDDPWLWFEKGADVQNKCGCFDLVMVSSTSKLDEYKKYGAKDAICVFPGFDPKKHFPNPSSSKQYKYDVSFCFTNLYDDKTYFDQFIQRKQLVDDLVQQKDIRFALFGPQHLKILYPEHHQGHIPYSKTSEIFNQSKINLCTHVCHNFDHYVNERCILVLGSGGLLLVDPVKKLDEILNEECVFLKKEGYISQIKYILKHYESYEQIKINGYQKAMNEFTWDHVAEKMHMHICKHFFDPIYYQSLLPETESSSNESELWNHWMSEGRKTYSFPFRIIQTCHKRQSRQTPKIGRDFQNFLAQIDMDFQGWCKITSILCDIDKNENLNTKNWEVLEKICNMYPNVDINDILQFYFDSIG